MHRPQSRDNSLSGRAARGLTWTVVETWSQQGLNLVVFLVLARLLLPEQIGVVALASVFVALAQLVVSQGLGFALIQRHDLTPSHIDTAFWISVTAGGLLTASTVVIAHPVAALLAEPSLAPILQWLSLSFILYALAAVQIALLRRNLALRQLAIRAAVSVGGGGVVGVVMAVLGAGAYALVGQQLTVAAFSAAAVWQLSAWRPSLRLSFDRLREMVSFSLNVIGSDLLSWVGRNADNLLIGVFLGTTPLGLYSVAYRMLDVTQALFVNVARNIAFPALSRLQQEHDRMARAYLRVSKVGSDVIMPGYLLLALLAPDLTVVLVGERWTTSGEVAAILFLIGPVLSVQAFSSSMLYAAGQPSIVLRFRLVTTVVNVLGFALAVPFGIYAVAAAYVARGYVLLPLILYWMSKYAGVPAGRYMRQLVPSLLACGTMVAGVLVVKLLLADRLDQAALIGVELVAAVLLYYTSMRLVGRDHLEDLATVLGSALPEPERGWRSALLAMLRRSRTGDL